MEFLSHSHRRFEIIRGLRLSGESAPESFEAGAAKVEFERRFFEGKTIEELARLTPGETAAEVEQAFAAKFGPDKYEEEMRAYLDQHAPENVRGRLLKDSLARYKDEYERAKTLFYRETEQGIGEWEDRQEAVEDKVHDELDLMGDQVGRARAAETAVPAVEDARPKVEKAWYNQIPLVSPLLNLGDYGEYVKFKSEMSDKFLGEYIPALNDKYMNPDWQEQHLTPNDLNEYEDLSKEFKAGMQEFVKGRLEFAFEKGKDTETLQKELEGLRDELGNRYAAIAREDGMIDLPELRKLKKGATQCFDVVRLLQSGQNEEEVARRLEAMQFMNREAWIEGTGLLVEEWERLAERTGCEARFARVMTEMTGATTPLSYDEAKDRLEELMKSRAKVSVVETLKVAHEFNTKVFAGEIDLVGLSDVPESIRPMVETERRKLMDGVTIPKNVDDRMLVLFMREEREGRNRILSSVTEREALFQAIQNVLARQNLPEWSRRIQAIQSKKTSDLTTSRKPEKPTGHDELARHLALVAMAKEAEWTVKNISEHPDYAGQKLAERLEQVEAEKAPPKMDLRFRDINRRYSARYVSEVSRAGFNGKDLGLLALQIWAGATFVLNWKQGGFTEIGKLAKNPFAIGSAALVFGIDRYKKNPEVKNYLFENAGGQERIGEHLTLRSLSKKVGSSELKGFINNADEFKAMESMFKEGPKEGVSKVKALIQKADKRYSPYPVILKEDLAGVAEDAPQSQLRTSNDKRLERTRYLFYKSFLMKEVNIRQLKENCEKWIAS